MRKVAVFFASLCATALLFSANAARAQTVMWVSATGSGTTCSTASPCGTFQAAITAGATEIHCLNSGNYGPFTITASIIIDCGTGNVGTVSVPGTNAITISAGSAANITLRHLSVNGNNTGNGSAINPISIPAGSLMVVEDCVFQGFTGPGLFFGTNSGRGTLQVSNSRILNNGTGIQIDAAAATSIETIALNQVEVAGNSGNGISLTGPGVIAGTIRNSLIASNTQDGVSTNASQVYFTVEESSVIANLSNGIHTTSAGSNLNVTASTISANGTGIKAASGAIVSFGNNTLNGNAANGNFTSTAALQ